jgi:hypothetical protein
MAQGKAPTVRRKRIIVSVNDEELKQFKPLAAAEHKSLAQYLREYLYSRLKERKKGIAA